MSPFCAYKSCLVLITSKPQKIYKEKWSVILWAVDISHVVNKNKLPTGEKLMKCSYVAQRAAN